MTIAVVKANIYFQGTRTSKNIDIKYEVEVEEILTRAEYLQRGNNQQEETTSEYPVYVR